MSAESDTPIQRQHAQDAQQDRPLAPASSNKTSIEVTQADTPAPFGTNTTLQALKVLESDLNKFVDAEVAKNLVNTMRVVMQQGYTKRAFLEVRRQKILKIVEGTDNEDVKTSYSIFARAHAEAEKRVSYRLPILGDEVDDKMGEGRVTDAVAEPQVGEPCARTSESAMARAMTSEEVEIEDAGAAGTAGRRHSDEPVSLQRKMGPKTITTKMTQEATCQQAARSRPAPPLGIAILAGITCDSHNDGLCTLIPIQNPNDFPVTQIQEVQAQYIPSTRVLHVWLHRDSNNQIHQVTVDLDKSSVDHLIIQDPKIITFLGLRQPPIDIISLQSDGIVEPTYKIKILPGQRPRNPKLWIVGELVIARHAYLYWLDSRQSADPRAPPTASEAKTLALQLKRRPNDVFQEINRYWDLEQGSGGRLYRENRKRYLGEDPKYPEGEEKIPTRSQWS
ncbi:hypothetical protein Ptr902_00854 [Pyrenophora tritici-repentis]|nr:hypothetical protein Ptr902_00854 [Pyrenophora tritici-repentis]